MAEMNVFDTFLPSKLNFLCTFCTQMQWIKILIYIQNLFKAAFKIVKVPIYFQIINSHTILALVKKIIYVSLSVC